MIGTWPCKLPDGRTSEEYALQIGEKADHLVLVIPPFFNEHNLMRHHLVQVMRMLAEAGVSSVLPDLPGCNESLEPIDHQTLSGWRGAVAAAANHFGARHILAVRSGALTVPEEAEGWQYAPQTGAKFLRGMLRARVIASREAGQNETSEALLETGRTSGIDLAGWHLGSAMVRELEEAAPVISPGYSVIEQSEIRGSGLWLRAEPGEDEEQARKLSAIILRDLGVTR